jgi:hypothetical protein
MFLNYPVLDPSSFANFKTTCQGRIGFPYLIGIQSNSLGILCRKTPFVPAFEPSKVISLTEFSSEFQMVNAT